MIASLLAADQWLFGVLNGSLHWGPVDALMMTASEVKHFYLFVGLFFALLVWKGGRTGRATALFLVLTIIASDQIASFVIKPFVDRVRPCSAIASAIVLGGCGAGKSFPSTHAMNSFAFMTVLAAAYPKQRRWLFAVAALISYSRIHVGAHYPLDVLCGAGFGYALGKGMIALRRVVRRNAVRTLLWMDDTYRGMRYFCEWLWKRTYALPVFSGMILGLAYPAFHYGIIAAFGLVPLLFAIENVERKHWWSYFKIFYVSLFVWHAIANYWIGGWSAEADPFLMIACVVLMFVHPLFLMVPLAAYTWVRNRLGLLQALVLLPFVWVGFEYLHSIGDLGYPWLTLGNTQTYYIEWIQYLEYTGVYGASFILMLQNVSIFLMIRAWRSHGSLTIPNAVRIAFVMLVASIALPALHGEWVFRENDLHAPPARPFRVSVIQPNIDPWAKWTTADVDSQVAQLKAQSRVALAQHPDLLVWPETAIPYFITTAMHREDLDALHQFVDQSAVPLLTGVPDRVFYAPGQPHPADAQALSNGGATAAFNSSTIITPGSRATPMYHKMQLVPFGERTPFVDEFPIFAKFIAWSVGLSGWSKGTDYTVFPAVHGSDSAEVYAMICYESVYPSLVRQFPLRGANLLVVITNDGWYGRTNGPVQHQQYAVLRAIENRRAIARCANTGVSCFIDKFGNVDQRTPLYAEATISRTCLLNDEPTFYTLHGDWLSWICCGVWGLGLIAGVVRGRSSAEVRDDE